MENSPYDDCDIMFQHFPLQTHAMLYPKKKILLKLEMNNEMFHMKNENVSKDKLIIDLKEAPKEFEEGN